MFCIRFQSTLPARGATERRGEVHSQFSISIHAPRTGSDGLCCARSDGQDYHFNPRSPHGERHNVKTDWLQSVYISIHAPRTGSDAITAFPWEDTGTFQSTLPARGATKHAGVRRPPGGYFNPRSPHGERLDVVPGIQLRDVHFNPRSPHGERPKPASYLCRASAFQSTLPARGATAQSNNSVDQNHRLCTKSIPQNSPFEN